jgi:hypothetical protein
MTFGHIAHYNLHGFYGTFFDNTRSKIEFLAQTVSGGGYGDPKYTYSDVEKVLSAWVRDRKLVDYYRGRLDAEVEQAEKSELARLTFKYGGNR